ncbi:MAG TPA: hypothetical protein VFD52_01715 [Clostridia bacterium]|nr:hypothetical protein [Clostridia bacterium]
MENELTLELTVHFSELIKKYSQNNENALHYEIEMLYKNPSSQKDLMFVSGNINFKSFTLKCIYIVNPGLVGESSWLECKVEFADDPDWAEYSFYDILNIVNTNDFNNYTVYYIDSKDTMTRAVEYLLKSFDKYYDNILELSQHKEERKELLSNLVNDINNFFGENVFDQKKTRFDKIPLSFKFQWFSNFISTRFNSKAYLSFMKGDFKKALRKYSRLKGLTLYEKRLVAFMNNNRGEEVKSIISSSFSVEQSKKIQLNKKRDILVYDFGVLALAVPFSLFYAGVYWLFNFIANKDALFITHGHPFLIVLCSFISAIVLVKLFRRQFYKFLFRKSAEKMLEYDSIVSDEKTNRSILLKTDVAVILCALLILFSVNKNLTFRENGFVDKTNFTSLSGNLISYEKVEAVYHLSAQEGEYVIVLDNNRYYNLSHYANDDEIRERILPILADNNIEVKTIKDLPENLIAVG